MRLICPHCMSGVTVPDDTAGKDATCPNCSKTFPTPARYTAEVAALDPPTTEVTPIGGAPEVAPMPRTVPAQQPPAPPGYVPPAPVPPPVPGSGFLPPAPAEVPPMAGYTKARGITISPKVVAWLPAVFFVLALFLTFFPWVGTHIGGHTVYSQGPWRAMFGYVNKNSGLEAVAPPGTIGWTDKVRSDWLLMLPFLLLLLLTTALALAERGVGAFGPDKIPPLAKIWPVRHTVIAALGVAAVALVVIQSLNGFGLERAVRQVVREDPLVVQVREAAKDNEAKRIVADQVEEQVLARFNLSRTTAMHLAVSFTVLGALMALGVLILERRGNKPPPKLLLHY